MIIFIQWLLVYFIWAGYELNKATPEAKLLAKIRRGGSVNPKTGIAIAIGLIVLTMFSVLMPMYPIQPETVAHWVRGYLHGE